MCQTKSFHRRISRFTHVDEVEFFGWEAKGGEVVARHHYIGQRSHCCDIHSALLERSLFAKERLADVEAASVDSWSRLQGYRFVDVECRLVNLHLNECTSHIIISLAVFDSQGILCGTLYIFNYALLAEVGTVDLLAGNHICQVGVAVRHHIVALDARRVFGCEIERGFAVAHAHSVV